MMSTITLPARISSSGEITISPIPDWKGSATETEIIVRLPETAKEENKRRAAAQKFFDTWNGALEGMSDMTDNEIHRERLEKRYGK